MDREELGKMKLEALRTLAAERGLAGAHGLGKAALIDHLAPRGLVERAKEKVEHAVEAVEERAHRLAERVRHHDLHAHHDAPAATGPKATAATATDATATATANAAPATASATAATASATPARRSNGSGNGFGVPSATVHPHAPSETVREPLGMLDLEELPETYGVDECEVLYKDPFWVFAYWEVTDGGLEAARAQLGQSAEAARLVLRLFTTVPTADGVDRQIHDVELPSAHGRRYLQSPRPGAHLRVAVGLLSREGYFAPIAHSSLLRVPPAAAQPGPVEWMEVVPPRTRGRTREPLVIVRRGAEHAERGVTVPETLAPYVPSGSSPSAAPARPGQPGWPFGGSSSSSSPTRGTR